MAITSDIVTRLREKYQGQLPICAEAADEIERLHWELELATKWRDNYKLEIESLKAELTRIDTALKTVLAVASEAVYGE